jgi:hypothetical protein
MKIFVGTWDFGRNLKYKNELIRRIHGFEPGTSEGTLNVYMGWNLGLRKELKIQK